MVAELSPLRILTHLDRAALASYCGAYGMWAEATEAIQKFGTMVKSPSGYPVQSPYVSNRQPPDRDHDADRIRVRLYARESEAHRSSNGGGR
jgi:P27 family predicted phage terminase small subunit